MSAKRVFTTTTLVLVLAALIVTPVFAGTISITKNGITLTSPYYPLTGPGYASCEPWAIPEMNTISLAGIPEGSTVMAQFVYSAPYIGSPIYLPILWYYGVTGGSLVIPVSYPMDSTLWPLFNAATNERAIAVAAFIQVTAPSGLVTKLIAKQWWIRCIPPPDFEGCTPGYWRQEQHYDAWIPTGLMPTDAYSLLFGVIPGFSPDMLGYAVQLEGGGEFALARHAVAAMLNALHPDVDYKYTPAEVIAGVQAAYASGDFETFKGLLDWANNAGCPLN